jgi:hypothetical protein
MMGSKQMIVFGGDAGTGTGHNDVWVLRSIIRLVPFWGTPPAQFLSAVTISKTTG